MSLRKVPSVDQKRIDTAKGSSLRSFCLSLRLAGLATVAISSTVLFGWVYGSESLIRIAPSFSAMNPVTAGLFFFWGATLFFFWPQPRRWVCLLSGVFLVAVSSVRLAAETSLTSWRIDHVLFSDYIFSSGAAHSSVSPVTALCFLTVGLALLSLAIVRSGRVQGWLVVGLYSLVSLLGLVGLLGHWANLLGLLESGLFISLALHTTTLFFFLGTLSGLERLRTLLGSPSMRKVVIYILLFVSFVVPMVLTLNAWRSMTAYADVQQDLIFTWRVDHLEHETLKYLDENLEILQGIRGLFAASKSIEPEEWSIFLRSFDVDVKDQVLESIGFSPVISGDFLEQETIRVRQLLWPDFLVYPAGQRELYVPIEYVAPTTPANLRTVGFDKFSEPSRREAMERARDTGEPTVTHRLTLVQDEGFGESGYARHPGFVIFLPVYAPDLPVDTIEERRMALTGFVFATYRADHFFQTIKEREGFEDVSLAVFDGNSRGFLNQFYGDEGSGEEGVCQEERIMSIMGRDWVFCYAAREIFDYGLGRHVLPISILISGTVFSLLLLLIIYLILVSREKAVAYAGRLTKRLSHSVRELARSKARSDAILAGLGEGLVVTDQNGRIELTNVVFERMSGWSKSDLTGQMLCEMVPLLNDKGVTIGSDQRPECRSVKGGRPYISALTDNFSLRRRSGESLPVSLSVAPISLFGKTRGAAVLFRDVTRERQTDKAKTEFVSLASHQLKTPLTAIGWNTELLLTDQSKGLKVKQKETLREIAEGNRRMVNLVNALLNTSRIDLGTFSIDPKEANLSKIVEDVIGDFEPEITNKSLTLHKKIGARLTKVRLDPMLVRIIIQNLLSNAVKYTPPGGHIKIVCELRGEEMLIRVGDTGYGIPKKQHHQVFNKLFRADNIVDKDISGTGLGLYIVKSVVEKAGGRIWFRSEEGRGTAFFVSFPQSGMKKKKGSRRLS